MLEWIDKSAYACAAAWSGHYCVTAYVGNVRFHQPLHVGDLVEALGPAREARLRLVVSGLHYLVMEQDMVPDGGPHGYADDLAVMRWVTRVVAGGEGHPVDELNGY